MEHYKVKYWKDGADKKHWHVEERGIAIWHGDREECLKYAEQLNRLARR